MALDWRISFDAGAGYVRLPDVQAINISRGRRRVIDPYQVETCEIVSREPTNWTTIPKVGYPVLAYVYGSYQPAYPSRVYNVMFQGYISDVKINYGLTPDLDVVTISCEGLQAVFGRAQLTNKNFPEKQILFTYSDLCDELGEPTWGGSSNSFNSAITNFNGNALEFVNSLLYTEQGLLRSSISGFTESLNMGTLEFISRNTNNSGRLTPLEFSDGTVAPPYPNYAFTYDQIEFKSAADDYYNEVTVQPAGLANQTANTGVNPPTTYVLKTYDATTSQAFQLANYVLNRFLDPDSSIRSISARVDNQTNVADMIVNLAYYWSSVTRIILRGNVYNVTMQGWNISATPGDQTRVTMFTAAGDTNAYLKLDDPYYGRLDYNRLGF